MKLFWPVKNIATTPGIYIAQYFGGNEKIYSQFGMKGHNGIDVACPVGTPLLAMYDGIVSYETETQNFGNGYGMDARLKFTLDGLEWEIIYGHLSKYGTPGKVKRGDVIGWSGNTGFSTGPHVHFGKRLWQNGQVLDYNNGYYGWVDCAKDMAMIARLVHCVGTEELGYYIPADSMGRFASLSVEMRNLSDYQLEEIPHEIKKSWHDLL